MILVVLIFAGIPLAAFVVLVVGVRATDHRMRLCDPSQGGHADAFARKVLGVYVCQQAGRSMPDSRPPAAAE